MYCTKCGNEIKNEAIFCTKCGTPVKQEELNIGEEAEAMSDNSLEILSGPIHNFLCYMGGVIVIFMGLLLPAAIIEFELGYVFFSLICIAVGILPSVFLVKNMRKLLGRFSVFAFILAPIKGIAAGLKLASDVSAVCFFFIPPIALLMAFLSECIGDFGYMWVNYEENPKGKVCFK